LSWAQACSFDDAGEATGLYVFAIQELAGRRNISTTMRYMHLSPSTLGDACAPSTTLAGDDDYFCRQRASEANPPPGPPG
jgi:hypothetical protein